MLLPLLALAAVACSSATVVGPSALSTAPSMSSASGSSPSSPSSPSASVGGTPGWRTDPDEPYPFLTPIPAFVATPIDGVYTRRPTDDYAGPLPPCRRCPPYPRDRGVSRLTLDSGRFQMEHSRPEYRSVGHFRIVADRIELFNDAECADVSGSYRWRLADGELTFDDPQDPCGFEQRRKDLTALTWQSMDAVVGRPECQPPDQEAAVSGHWPIPSGC